MKLTNDMYEKSVRNMFNILRGNHPNKELTKNLKNLNISVLGVNDEYKKENSLRDDMDMKHGVDVIANERIFFSIRFKNNKHYKNDFGDFTIRTSSKYDIKYSELFKIYDSMNLCTYATYGLFGAYDNQLPCPNIDHVKLIHFQHMAWWLRQFDMNRIEEIEEVNKEEGGKFVSIPIKFLQNYNTCFSDAFGVNNVAYEWRDYNVNDISNRPSAIEWGEKWESIRMMNEDDNEYEWNMSTMKYVTDKVDIM